MALQWYVVVKFVAWMRRADCLGMAMRLAFDLALHVDVSRHVARKSLSEAEANLRRDVFWGAYTVDQ